jgi:hypothetical protein
VRALTQEELLAEAAETELANTASLARLIAVEEEARRGAARPPAPLLGAACASASCPAEQGLVPVLPAGLSVCHAGGTALACIGSPAFVCG